MRMILVLMPMFAWNFIYAQPFTIDAAASGFRTREERVGFAKSLIKYFDRLDSQIPNLHPREEDWVIKEGNRIISIPDLIEQVSEGQKLMSSKDWKIFAAKREAAELRGQLQSIVDRGYLTVTLDLDFAANSPTLRGFSRKYLLPGVLTDSSKKRTMVSKRPDVPESEILAWSEFSELVLRSRLFELMEGIGIENPRSAINVQSIYSDELLKAPGTAIEAAINGLVIQPFLEKLVVKAMKQQENQP